MADEKEVIGFVIAGSAGDTSDNLIDEAAKFVGVSVKPNEEVSITLCVSCAEELATKLGEGKDWDLWLGNRRDKATAIYAGDCQPNERFCEKCYKDICVASPAEVQAESPVTTTKFHLLSKVLQR